MKIASNNVGRIAERIAMNELEARGFHIIDLAYSSKTSANVDFIASKGGCSRNIQVKGMTNTLVGATPRWSVQYGYCDEEVISRKRPFYNASSDAPLQADAIVLLAVNSPSRYRAIIMSIATAEAAAQINIDCYYRQPKVGGGVRKPGKVWIELDPAKAPRKLDLEKERERAILVANEGAWESLTN